MISTNKEINVPFVDLHAQYLELKDEIDNVIKKVIKSSSFIRGDYVLKFEEDFSRYLGIKNCISCANGTDALYIAMKALGVKSGDEVIVPAHSWISTSETVTQAGGKVIFCDTKKDTFNIDPSKIEEKITSKTVGIIPVHLCGKPAEIKSIIKIAKENNIWILEDCAQAHGAMYHDQKVGTFGDAATFSFYPGKNLGAMGDAGAIVTNNDFLATKMAMFARHGGLKKGEHLIEGINSRLDGLQAAILSVKLPKLEEWNLRRQKNAEKYNELLFSNENLILPFSSKNSEDVWHLYMIKTDHRDELIEKLNSHNIKTGLNYPVSLPFLEAYKNYNHSPKDFPNAFYNQSRILSLPMYPHLTDMQINHVVSILKELQNK